MSRATNDPPRTGGTGPVLAGRLTIIESVVVIGFFAFYLYEMLGGATDDLVRAGTSSALILLWGGFLAVVGRAWLRGASWPRTPTILWNVLLLPVAWSLHESGRTLIAIGVAVLAAASIWAALASPMSSAEDRDRVS